MGNTVDISLKPSHALSPFLYMQFAEPLGTADSSIDAAWNFLDNDWQAAVIDILKELAPPMIRWGGCFASYYHWWEGVGPTRIPMHNLCWDGIYLNQVGTDELARLSRMLEAELLLCVNFESEGRECWAHPRKGLDRKGTPEEAAAWVRYCNAPDDRKRIENGFKEPYNVKYWQLGNETGYQPPCFSEPGFSSKENCCAANRFIDAMRKEDSSIKFIVWGDGPNQEWKARYQEGKLNSWAVDICEAAGDRAQFIAFHNHFGLGDEFSGLWGGRYREDAERTWQLLSLAVEDFAARIEYMRRSIAPYGMKLAMTEGHLAVNGRQSGRLFSSWASGVATALCANMLEKNGDILEIATLADFMGNNWQSNAIILPAPAWTPGAKPYFMPAGTIMKLFSQHVGEHAIKVKCPDYVDIAGSISSDRLFLHVVNKDRTQSHRLDLQSAFPVESLDVWEISADSTMEVGDLNKDVFSPRHFTLKGSSYTLPASGVAAIEIRKRA